VNQGRKFRRILLIRPVNEILGDHNVDKQMTDSKGQVYVQVISSSPRHDLTIFL
jgi:hypothetical protein